MSALADTTNTINMDTEVVGKDNAKIENAAEVVKNTEASVQDSSTVVAEASVETSAVVSDATPAEATATLEVPQAVEALAESADVKAVDPVEDSTSSPATEATVDAEHVAAQEVETVVVQETTPVPMEETTDAVVEETPVQTMEATEAVVEETPVSTEVATEAAVEETPVPTEAATEAATEEVPTEATAEAVVEETTAEKQARFEKNLVSGRRFIETLEFSKAADMLSSANSLATELFGEGDENTFESMFLYGKALLEVCKMEDSVFNNALTGIPKDGEDGETTGDVVENPENVPQGERAEIKQKVEEALGVVREEPIEEETSETVESDENKEGDEEAETVEDDSAVEENACEVDDVEKKADDVEMEVAENEAEEQEQGESDGEEDDDQMKLSWEILEFSRCICDKKIKSLEADEKSDSEALKTWQLNKANVLTALGEHGIIDSKHEQAKIDLISALELQTSLLAATSRILANTNHLIGKAFSGDALFDKAAIYFSDAKDILISKVEELKKQLEGAVEEAKSEIESEIKEIEGVIPDIELLITDALASEEQNNKIKKQAKMELESVAEAISKIPTEETNDISSMVRRPTKRPAAETEQAEDAKKRKSADNVEVATVATGETAPEDTKEAAPVAAEETAMEVVEESVAPASEAPAE